MTLKAKWKDAIVFSHKLDKQSWAQIEEDARQGLVQLACCGQAAVPKTLMSGEKIFAHGKGALQNCFWKQTGAHHDSILSNAYMGALRASYKVPGFWEINTEIRLGGVCLDLLLSRRDSDIKIAVMIETSPHKNNRDLDEETKSLLDAGVTRVYWAVPAGADRAVKSKNVTPYKLYGDVSAEKVCFNLAYKTIMDIEAVLRRAEFVRNNALELGYSTSDKVSRGLIYAVDVKADGLVYPVAVSRTVDMKRPAHDQGYKALQSTLINAFKSALPADNSIQLWWPSKRSRAAS